MAHPKRAGSPSGRFDPSTLIRSINGDNLAVALPSCVSLQVRAGRRPNTDLLESQLTLGKSSEADVSRILGAPLGRGRAAIPHHSLGQADNMWTYYYEEGTLEESRRVFLFVVF